MVLPNRPRALIRLVHIALLVTAAHGVDVHGRDAELHASGDWSAPSGHAARRDSGSSWLNAMIANASALLDGHKVLESFTQKKVESGTGLQNNQVLGSFTQKGVGAEYGRVLYIDHTGTIRDTTVDQLPGPNRGWVRIVAVSDTHTQENVLTERYGPLSDARPDLIIFAGDFLFKGKYANGTESIQKPYNWLKDQAGGTEFVFIGGNHDMVLDKALENLNEKLPRVLTGQKQYPGYLEDELREFGELGGLRVYGSPVSRPYVNGGETEDGDTLKGNKAFQANTFARVAKIPDKVGFLDVLITHGPPKNIGDTVDGKPIGCPKLAKKVREIKPRLHLFGHLHAQGGPGPSPGEGESPWPHGNTRAFVDQETGTISVNVCVLRDFAPVSGGHLYPPVVIDLPRRNQPSNSGASAASLLMLFSLFQVFGW